MILAQPGKREVRKRAYDSAFLVYRFDPTFETAMQWEIIQVFDDLAEARAFAFPKSERKAA